MTDKKKEPQSQGWGYRPDPDAPKNRRERRDRQFNRGKYATSPKRRR
jgi:hypothetical protein